jgi:hypothetical protein
MIDEIAFAPMDDTGTQLFFRLVAPLPKSASRSGSPATSPSTNGASSWPSRRRLSASSTGSSITASWFPPMASRPHVRSAPEAGWSHDMNALIKCEG